MTTFKGDLQPGMRDNPIVWWLPPHPNVRIPKVQPEFFQALWPEKGNRLKTWGHVDGPLSAHWLAVRGGTPLHVDPKYARYSVQVQVYNEGLFTRGVSDDLDVYPVLTPGVIICLDTHSPHRVMPDARIGARGGRLCKLQAGLDSWELPAPAEAIHALAAFLRRQRLTVPREAA